MTFVIAIVIALKVKTLVRIIPMKKARNITFIAAKNKPPIRQSIYSIEAFNTCGECNNFAKIKSDD